MKYSRIKVGNVIVWRKNKQCNLGVNDFIGCVSKVKKCKWAKTCKKSARWNKESCEGYCLELEDGRSDRCEWVFEKASERQTFLFYITGEKVDE